MTSSPPNSPPVLRANVTKQNGEITCTVQETNRIRAALGLKPLRIASEQIAKREKELAHSDDAPALRAVVKANNGEITCSVEETNRIRAALGLRPLRTEQTVAKPEAVEEKPAPRKTIDLKERLERARRARITRAKSVAVRSIAEEALLEEDSDDEPVDQVSRLMAWVERSRKSEKGSGTKTKSKAPLQRRNIISPMNKADVNRNTTKLSLPESPVHGEILTLADASILPGDKKDEEKSHAEDSLVNPLKVVKKRPRSPEICGAAYDGTDNKEFSGDVQMGPGTVSIEHSGTKVVESDYKVDRKMAGEKALRKRRKRDKNNPEKKRRRTRAVEEEDYSDTRQMNENSKVKKGRMKEIRRAANNEANLDGGSDSDDPFYATLAKATRRAKEKEVKSSVDTILEAIDRANAVVVTEGNEATAAVQDAERSVYNEMEQFLQQIPAARDSSDEEGDNKSNEKHVIPKEKEEIVVAVKNISKVVEEPLERASNGTETTSVPEGPVQLSHRDQVAKPPLQPAAEAPGLPTAPVAESGVAATLRRLRAMGELKHKPNQIGRARDKRFHDDTEIKTRENSTHEITLSYTDEYGNELTRKEAFRMLCHKFHGKGPGQNKREKRLRKMLESTKTLQMKADDTPLASAAALKEETRKLGTAHVVLSGPEALARGLALSKSREKTEEKSLAKVEQIVEENKEAEPEEEKVSISFGLGGSKGAGRKRR